MGETVEERIERAARNISEVLEGCLPRQRRQLERALDALESIREEMEYDRTKEEP